MCAHLVDAGSYPLSQDFISFQGVNKSQHRFYQIIDQRRYADKSHIGITLWYGFVVSLSCGEGLFYGFLGMTICILSGLAVGGHFGQCGTGNKERPVVVYGDLDSIGKHGLYLSSYVKTDNAESGGYLYPFGGGHQ